MTNTFIFKIFHCIYVPHLYSFIFFSLTCVISLNVLNSLCGGFHSHPRTKKLSLGYAMEFFQATLLEKGWTWARRPGQAAPKNPARSQAWRYTLSHLFLKGELRLLTFSFRKTMLGLNITLDHKSQTLAFK